MLSFKQAWLSLTEDQKKFSILIFVMMFFSMILEALSIGIILPLLSIFLKGNLDSSAFSYFFTFFGNPKGNELIYVGLFVTMGIFLVKNIYLIFFQWCQIKFIQKLNVEISDKLFKSYLHRDYFFFLKTNTAQLIRNVTSEIASFVEYINNALVLFRETTVLIGITVILFYVDFFITFIVLFLVGIFSFLIYRFTRKKIAIFGKERILTDGLLTKHFIQGLTSVKDVKILNREDDLVGQVYKNLLKRRKINIFIGLIGSLPKYLFEILVVCIFVLLVFIMISMNKNFTDIMQYLGLFAVATFRIIPATTRIVTSFQQTKFRQPTVENLYEQLGDASNNAIKDSAQRVNNKPIKFEKQIKIEKLCFSYPTRDKFNLSEISININKGDFVGIVGETGSGKSTLINLLTGLLNPTGGKLEVDELNIHSNLVSWHKKIGYVPQSIYLLDDSIKKNIAFGLEDKDINDNLVKHAIKKANLNELVEKLPNGMDTIVGEKGIKFSGGQQQRIGIARSLYHDPEILILDEATSSLDLSTEKKIMQSIQALKGKKTLIVVTHRLSTVQHCDNIFYISNGKIIKQGSPKEVLDNL